ncbi:MAG: hypothetical protein JWM89_2444 [Acidimicrobiales bacterium]|nr:hypothetical protein [Acidimicrobiales bacterium]
MAQWTNQPETPAVYHINPDCPRVKKIAPEHLRSGAPPPGRSRCRDC